MRMHQIKIFHSFLPNLREIHQFGKKIAFSVKLRPILGPWQLKKLILGLKTVYL